MSQEEPTLVVSPIERKFISGAGIVASHAAGLGAKTTFISIAGEDGNRDFAREKLAGNGVNTCLFTDHGPQRSNSVTAMEIPLRVAIYAKMLCRKCFSQCFRKSA